MASINANHLTIIPFDEGSIESIAAASTYMSREKLIEMLTRVCLSHERLRAELKGAESLIDTMDRKERHGCANFNCAECDR